MKKLIYALTTLLLVGNCKQDVEPSDDATRPIDSLSDSELAYWESLGVDKTSKSSDLQFEDGTPMSNWLKVYNPTFLSQYESTASTNSTPSSANKLKGLIASYEYAAKWLADRSNFTQYSDQNGIAYVYASSDYLTKSVCSKSNECVCSTPMHGLDCSGYIYQMFDIAKLPILRASTSDYLNLSLWNNALSKSNEYNGLIMTDIKTRVPVKQLRVGDIVVNPGHHMGVVAMVDGQKKFFNSLGQPKRSCAVNSNDTHGPVMSPQNGSIEDLSEAAVDEMFQGHNYHVLRFVSPNTLFNGSTLSGPLAQYVLNGSPSYNGSMKVINLSFEMETDQSLTSISNADFTFNISSPDIPRFSSDGVTSDDEIGTTSISNGRVTINFPKTRAVFTGTISGGSISGTFTCPGTYRDLPTNRITPVTFTTPVSITKQ